MLCTVCHILDPAFHEKGSRLVRFLAMRTLPESHRWILMTGRSPWSGWIQESEGHTAQDENASQHTGNYLKGSTYTQNRPETHWTVLKTVQNTTNAA